MLSRSLVARQSWPDCLPSPARKRHVLEQRSPVKCPANGRRRSKRTIAGRQMRAAARRTSCSRTSQQNDHLTLHDHCSTAVAPCQMTRSHVGLNRMPQASRTVRQRTQSSCQSRDRSRSRPSSTGLQSHCSASDSTARRPLARAHVGLARRELTRPS